MESVLKMQFEKYYENKKRVSILATLVASLLHIANEFHVSIW